MTCTPGVCKCSSHITEYASDGVRLPILLVVSLTGQNEYFPFPIRAWEFDLARRVRPSRPASACSLPTLSMNMMLTRGIPPDFRGGVHLLYRLYAIGSVPSLSGHAIAYRWRSWWAGERVDRLRTERHSGVWHSGGLKSDGIGGRGVGWDGHGGWAGVHDHVEEKRERRG